MLLNEEVSLSESVVTYIVFSDLYEHFEENEVTLMLFSTPWFLTMFASVLSLDLTARIFGKFLWFLFISECSFSFISPTLTWGALQSHCVNLKMQEHFYKYCNL